jgi:hypothetical protein
MAFDFSCPACRHTVQMDNSAVGEMGVCPKCEAEVLIQRNPVDSEPQEPQTQQEEQLLQTSPVSAPSKSVEIGTGTAIVTRIVMVVVFLCIMSGGGLMIYKGFEVFGLQYEGIVGMLEDEPNNELSEHQKMLLQQTLESTGPPDYSEYAVDLPPPTEEERNLGQSMGANATGLGGDSADGGESDNRGGQGSGGRSFDPEQIFDDRDEDMDGLLSGDEIVEWMGSRMEQMDENEDGAISKEEFLAAMQRFRSSRQGGGGEGRAPRGGGDAGRPE